jgi:hypothetical protein
VKQKKKMRLVYVPYLIFADVIMLALLALIIKELLQLAVRP